MPHAVALHGKSLLSSILLRFSVRISLHAATFSIW